MSSNETLSDQQVFSETLFERMKTLSPGVQELELYEFRYGLAELLPENGWDAVKLEHRKDIETRINTRTFYESILIKPKLGDRIILDPEIVRLSQMLFVGLVTGEYSPDWVEENFYFDIRSFFFYHRTVYFTNKVLAHFGGKHFQVLRAETEEIGTLPTGRL